MTGHSYFLDLFDIFLLDAFSKNLHHPNEPIWFGRARGAAFLRAGADQVIIAGSEDVRGPEPLYARRCTSVVQSLRASPIEA
jgi:hypothetical protein